jgi:hypothetical protein
MGHVKVYESIYWKRFCNLLSRDKFWSLIVASNCTQKLIKADQPMNFPLISLSLQSTIHHPKKKTATRLELFLLTNDFSSRCRRRKFVTRPSLTFLTTSLKIAALSGLHAVMSRLLICKNSPNCSMYSFSSSRRRFSLLHLLICDRG